MSPCLKRQFYKLLKLFRARSLVFYIRSKKYENIVQCAVARPFFVQPFRSDPSITECGFKLGSACLFGLIKFMILAFNCGFLSSMRQLPQIQD